MIGLRHLEILDPVCDLLLHGQWFSRHRDAGKPDLMFGAGVGVATDAAADIGLIGQPEWPRKDGTGRKIEAGVCARGVDAADIAVGVIPGVGLRHVQPVVESVFVSAAA